MYPNSALSAWQLAVMAVVPVLALAAWLTAIYLAARDTGGHGQAAAGSPPWDQPLPGRAPVRCPRGCGARVAVGLPCWPRSPEAGRPEAG